MCIYIIYISRHQYGLPKSQDTIPTALLPRTWSLCCWTRGQKSTQWSRSADGLPCTWQPIRGLAPEMVGSDVHLDPT